MFDKKYALAPLVCALGLAMVLGACSDDSGTTPDQGMQKDMGGSDMGGSDMGGSDMAVAKPRGPGNPPTPGTQIDRAGRVAITTALIKTFDADETKKNAAKDAYNAASPANQPTFAADIKASLAILDALDGTCGNQLAADQTATRYAFLAGVLADDQLWVNAASGTCGGAKGGSYLGVEAEALGVLTAGQGGCGGRTPQVDVIERTYSVLAAGVLDGVDDTIANDGKAHDKDTFPFLAAPN
jgi:hypothetical protein